MFGEDPLQKAPKKQAEPEQPKLRPDGKKRIENCLELTLSDGCLKAHLLVFEIADYP